MDEVEVDVEQVGQALRPADDVALPDACRRASSPYADASAEPCFRAPDCSVLSAFGPTLARMAVQDAPADAPLRRDVRMLGDLLGRVLVEQEDESLLDDVERVRGLARAARAGAPHDDLAAAVSGCRSSGRRASCARSRSTSRLRTSPSSSTGSAAGAPTRSRSESSRSRSTIRSPGSRRPRRGDRAPRLAPARAHGASDRSGAPHRLASHLRIARAARRARRPATCSASPRGDRGRARRRDHIALANG